MAYNVGTTEQVYVSTEGSFGALANPVAADGVRHLSVKLDYKEERVNRDDRGRGTKGVDEKISRAKKTTFQLDGYVVPSGISGTEPDIKDILGAIFDTPSTTSITTITSCTASGAVLTDPAAAAANQWIGVRMADGTVKAVFVTANIPVSGAPSGVISWIPTLPSAPVEGSAILSGINYPLKRKNLNSFTLHQLFGDPMFSNVGCKPEEMTVNVGGGEEAKISFKGFSKDQLMVCEAPLLWPMKANYAFSETGAGAVFPGPTSKSFKISVAGDAAEQIDLLGTEPTWAAVVNTINGVLSGLTGVNNAAAMAVPKAGGFYIRAGATGNGKDVLLTAGASNDYSVTGVLGSVNGGYELDADELIYNGIGGIDIGMKILVDSEIMTVVSTLSGVGVYYAFRLTVTRGGATDLAIATVIHPYNPGHTTSGSPASGFCGAFQLAEIVVGGVLYGVPYFAVADFPILDYSMTLTEGVKAIENVVGSQTPVGFHHGVRRSVKVKFSAYLTDTIVAMIPIIKAKIAIALTAQIGDSAGNIMALCTPKVELTSLPTPDTSVGDAVKDSFEGDALETNGEDELYIAFI